MMQQPFQVAGRDGFSGHAMVSPIWFGDKERPLCGWLHRPTDPVRGGAVVCPPLGYELWTSYQSYRRLADLLCAHGFYVLRFDYDGCGDSAGEELDPGRLDAWRNSVRAAVSAMTNWVDASAVTLIGLRFGAALAYEQAHVLGVGSLVLWDTVVSGRRNVRELRMLATKAELGMAAEVQEDVMEVAGCLYSAETVQSMSMLELLKIPVTELLGMPVLLLDREDRPANSALAARLAEQGASVEHRAVSGMSAMMDVSTEDAQIPQDILDNIVQWLRNVCSSSVSVANAVPAQALPVRATWMSNDSAISEELVQIGSQRLFAILGQPQSDALDKLVILLSSGTEHRIGPGRAWVSLARMLSAQGIASLRVDLNGIGDSPIRGASRRVRPYDPQFSEDVADYVGYARQRGYRRIIVLGLCSGAWMAVQAGVHLDVDGVVAINPQLYWQQGDPVESLIQDTRVRRAPERARELKGQQVGWWTVLDCLGMRPAASRWLDALKRKKVQTLLAFAEGDDGLEYLKIRCGRRFSNVLSSGVVTMVEVHGLDHPMHRYRRRPDMFAAITQFVRACSQ